MTRTQVAYWEYVEGKRHNLTTESQTEKQISETRRHNVRTENLTASQVAEQKRHNKATETLTASQIQEQGRHNRATEKLTATQIREQSRHNKVSESIDLKNANTNRMNANTNKTNANTRKQELAVSKQKVNIEQQKANEQARHNQMQEQLAAQANYISGVRTNNEAQRIGAQVKKDLATAKYTEEQVKYYATSLLAKSGNTVSSVLVASELLSDPSQLPGVKQVAKDVIKRVKPKIVYSNKIKGFNVYDDKTGTLYNPGFTL